MITEESRLAQYIQTLYDDFTSEQEWIFRIYRQDELDHAAIEYINGISNVDANGNESEIFDFLAEGTNDPDGGDDWRSRINMSIDVRVKTIALKAYYNQAYLTAGKIPISFKRTELPELNLMVNALNEEQKQRMFREMDERVRKASKRVKDQWEEGKVSDELVLCRADYAMFGVCAVESPVVRRCSVVQNLTTLGQDEEGNPILEVEPVVTEKKKLTAERISPYDVRLDPSADGNPQRGVGVFRRRYWNTHELFEYLLGIYNLKGSSKKKIDEFFEQADEQLYKDSENGPQASVRYQDDSDSVADMSIGYDTRTHDVLFFYGKVSKACLEEWGETQLLELIEEDPHYQQQVQGVSSKHRRYTSCEIEAVLVDGCLVYAIPLSTPDKKRPIYYSRRIPLYGTNYGYGSYSIVRPLTVERTRLMKNAIDNIILACNVVLAVVEQAIEAEDLDLTPGRVLKLKSNGDQLPAINTLIQQLNIDSRAGDIIQMLNNLDARFDEASAVPKNLTGFSPGTDTAYVAAQNMAAAQTTLYDQIYAFDTDIVAPIGESFYTFNMADPAIPDSEKAEMEVVATGVETFTKNVLNKQKFLELLNITMSMNEKIASQVNWDEFFNLILSVLDVPDVERLTIPKEKIVEDLRQQVEQLQQKAQQLQGQLTKAEQENSRLSEENGIMSRVTDVKIDNGKKDMEIQMLRKQQELEASRRKLVGGS